jgi:predicted GH43/DUF377 family glycosyl hydrolase
MSKTQWDDNHKIKNMKAPLVTRSETDIELNTEQSKQTCFNPVIRMQGKKQIIVSR